MNGEKIQIKLCMGSSCFTRGNEDILHVIKDFIASNHLEDKVDFRGHLCKGNCNCGPNMSINGVDYNEISESKIVLILNNALKSIIEKVQ